MTIVKQPHYMILGKVKNGTLFIAIAGNNNDGHDFIFDALDKCTVAVVANGRSPETGPCSNYSS